MLSLQDVARDHELVVRSRNAPQEPGTGFEVVEDFCSNEGFRHRRYRLSDKCGGQSDEIRGPRQDEGILGRNRMR